MIRLAIFDFDGTLFDTRQDITDAVNYARRWFGLPEHTIESVTTMVGYGVQTLAARAFAGTSVPVEEGLARIMDYYTAHPGDKSVLYPGVRETLPLIPAIRTIVSNKPEALVVAMLKDHGIDDLFEFAAGGDTFPVKKPDPLPVRFLQERYSLNEKEIVIVGDHAPDIEMAHAAGCHSIFCRYGFFAEDVTGADFQIDHFAQLLEILPTL